ADSVESQAREYFLPLFPAHLGIRHRHGPVGLTTRCKNTLFKRSPSSKSGAPKPTWTLVLRNHPQDVNRHGRSQDGASVADYVDYLVQMLDLQSVIQRVSEAVRPVKKRQRDQDEQEQTHDWVAYDRDEMRMARRRQPSQRERHAEKKNERGDEQRRQQTTGTEKQPQKRFERSPGHARHREPARPPARMSPPRPPSSMPRSASPPIPCPQRN